MTLPTDLEQFVREHRPYGGMMGDATEPAWNRPRRETPQQHEQPMEPRSCCSGWHRLRAATSAKVMGRSASVPSLEDARGPAMSRRALISHSQAGEGTRSSCSPEASWKPTRAA